METEVGSVPQEGQAPVVPVTETGPRYMTEDEVEQRLKAKLDELVPELEQRAFAKAQSYSDKTRNEVKRRVGDLKKILQHPEIAARLGEDAEVVERNVRADMVADTFAAENDEPEPQPPQQQQVNPAAQAFVEATMSALDLKPEEVWGTPLDPGRFTSAPAWQQAVRKAKQQQANPPSPVPPPAPLAPVAPKREPVAMDMGGGAVISSDPLVRIQRKFAEARAKGDLAGMREANEELRHLES